MKFDICVFGMAVLLDLCESEAQFGFGGGAAQNCVGSNCNQNNAFGGRNFGLGPGFGGSGVAVQNCVGSNCNSNNFFSRKRREVLEKVIAGFEGEEFTEKRHLLEEILAEVEEEELSGERRQPSLDYIGSSGLENPSRVSDLLQQIVDKLNELSLKLGFSSRSALPTFPAGTKFYTSDGRGGLSPIRAPVISLPVGEAPFENNLAKKTQGIGCLKLLDSLVGEAPFENKLDVKAEGIGCLNLLDSLLGEAPFENNLAKKTQGIGCLKLLDSLLGEAPFENKLDVKAEGIGCLNLLDSLLGEAPFENNLAKKTPGTSCLNLLDSLLGEAPIENKRDVKAQGIECFELLDSLTGTERREITKLLLKKILL